MQLGDAFSILYLLQISVTAAFDALCKQIGAGFHRDGGPMPSSCPLFEQRHNCEGRESEKALPRIDENRIRSALDILGWPARRSDRKRFDL